MKMVEVYLSTSWLNENTQRQRFRQREVGDLVSASTKLLKAAPMVALAGAGFSKGMVNPSLTLMNISTHTVKEIHNGVTNVGKNNGHFYQGIDTAKQPQMKKNAQSNSAGPLVRLWLVTDDDEANEAVIGKGVLFHSKTEAERFLHTYNHLDDYLSSKFYQQKDFVTLRVNDSDLPLFEQELHHYLQAREKSLRSEILVRPKLSPHNFALSRVYDEETGRLVRGEDGRYLVEIDFPVAVGQGALAKYFPKTIMASVSTESYLFSEAIADLETPDESEEEDSELSDVETASSQDSDIDDEEFEGPATTKGKEKSKWYYQRETEEEKSVNVAQEAKALKEELKPQADDRLSARQLTQRGVFKSSGNTSQREEENPDLLPPSSRPK